MEGVTARQRIRVTGTVQGVGFRPFVYRIATELGIVGEVGNDPAGVWIDAQGTPAALQSMRRRLLAEAPPLAIVTDVLVEAELAPHAVTSFVVAVSVDGGTDTTALPPDTAVCSACRDELLDVTDRRYRHPFITCTDCGPRLTITQALPYDRPNTTMARFPMCAACAQEYHDPADRRFHAQPIACNTCGPVLEFLRPGIERGEIQREAALAAGLESLAAGETVAIKGIGGFHLACNVEDGAAVERLRTRKRRGDKPFAVMVRDLDVARSIADIDEHEAALLTSPQSPIVLLRPADNPRAREIAAAVAPGNGRIGLLLPPSALHVLVLTRHPELAQPAFDAVVLTSCNFADEPICIDDERALNDFHELADAVLLHDRVIHVPCDDSVMRITTAADGVLPQPVRRSRGYAPTPIRLPFEVAPTLAVGGELKTTLCVAAGNQAWMSQHIGDTGDYATIQALDRVADIMLQVQRVQPSVVVSDRHPAYLSRGWAERFAAARGITSVNVQHHHAHLASLMAEHGIPLGQPVLGVTFDGTGYGDDGNIWGGEFLLGDYRAVTRVASLAPVSLPGGDAAVKRPARIALAHLHAAGIAWDPDLGPVRACDANELGVVRTMLDRGTACVPTTSVGRLFDAVAAVAAGIADAEYEGRAAIELEALSADTAGPDATGPSYQFALRDDARLLVDAAPVIRAVVRDALGGVEPGVIGDRFHRALAEAVCDVAIRVRANSGVDVVGLTGGVFQNALLTEYCSGLLTHSGFRVLVHRMVPANDGGLALGQICIARHLTIDHE